ncbi:type II toxin-antitoxin system RelE/ParE family toxin [Streptomyces sp. OP7]|uniref:type II toxin-antitoxin system RelE/ParE family toxin n=1 Tax=Streptomyces sp. OP7 TaxID=3142462 RepID=UPI0032E89604
MRELRPRSGTTVSIRMLFVFDPERRAIFLVAGNKAARRQWADWYPSGQRGRRQVHRLP